MLDRFSLSGCAITVSNIIGHRSAIKSTDLCGFEMLGFWLIWLTNQRALYNHALSVVVIGVVLHQHLVSIGICAHLPLAQG